MNAIVCGSGPEFWKDLERAQRVLPGAELVAVNLTGLYLPSVAHVVSLHPELLGPLRALRPSLDWCGESRPGLERGMPPVTHSWQAAEGVDRVWGVPPWGRTGTSSLFAVWVALGLGYERVLLAGVPLDGAGRFFDPPGATVWPHDTSDRPPWVQAANEVFQGRVQSCSGGWTAELLGEAA